MSLILLGSGTLEIVDQPYRLKIYQGLYNVRVFYSTLKFNQSALINALYALWNQKVYFVHTDSHKACLMPM